MQNECKKRHEDRIACKNVIPRGAAGSANFLRANV